MPSTTNFGWTTPADTDLVKDGAAAIRTLGNGVDASFVDLKGGTTGQILSKNSNTDLDFTWIANDQGDITAVTAGTGLTGGGTSGAVTLTNDMATTITASGDIVVGTGSGTYDNLPIGTTGQVLTADTTVSPYKVKWASPSSSGMTLISRQTFSNVASISFSNVFTTTYENYLFCFTNVSAATVADDLQCVFIKSGGTDQTTNYYGSSILHAFNAQTFTWTQSSNASEFTMFAYTEETCGYMFVTGSGAGQSGKLAINGSLTSLNSGYGVEIDAFVQSTQTYTGIKFKSSSTNITGTISVYGLVKA